MKAWLGGASYGLLRHGVSRPAGWVSRVSTRHDIGWERSARQGSAGKARLCDPVSGWSCLGTSRHDTAGRQWQGEAKQRAARRGIGTAEHGRQGVAALASRVEAGLVQAGLARRRAALSISQVAASAWPGTTWQALPCACALDRLRRTEGRRSGVHAGSPSWQARQVRARSGPGSLVRSSPGRLCSAGRRQVRLVVARQGRQGARLSNGAGRGWSPLVAAGQARRRLTSPGHTSPGPARLVMARQALHGTARIVVSSLRSATLCKAGSSGRGIRRWARSGSTGSGRRRVCWQGIARLGQALPAWEARDGNPRSGKAVFGRHGQACGREAQHRKAGKAARAQARCRQSARGGDGPARIGQSRRGQDRQGLAGTVRSAPAWTGAASLCSARPGWQAGVGPSTVAWVGSTQLGGAGTDGHGEARSGEARQASQRPVVRGSAARGSAAHGLGSAGSAQVDFARRRLLRSAGKACLGITRRVVPVRARHDVAGKVRLRPSCAALPGQAACGAAGMVEPVMACSGWVWHRSAGIGWSRCASVGVARRGRRGLLVYEGLAGEGPVGLRSSRPAWIGAEVAGWIVPSSVRHGSAGRAGSSVDGCARSGVVRPVSVRHGIVLHGRNGSPKYGSARGRFDQFGRLSISRTAASAGRAVRGTAIPAELLLRHRDRRLRASDGSSGCETFVGARRGRAGFASVGIAWRRRSRQGISRQARGSKALLATASRSGAGRARQGKTGHGPAWRRSSGQARIGSARRAPRGVVLLGRRGRASIVRVHPGDGRRVAQGLAGQARHRSASHPMARHGLSRQAWQVPVEARKGPASRGVVRQVRAGMDRLAPHVGRPGRSLLGRLGGGGQATACRGIAPQHRVRRGKAGRVLLGPEGSRTIRQGAGAHGRHGSTGTIRSGSAASGRHRRGWHGVRLVSVSVRQARPGAFRWGSA